MAVLASEDAQRLLDDVRTVVSELATNAVLHARTAFTVSFTLGEAGVRVAVSDGSPAQPRLTRLRDRQASTGRGLHMVADLSAAWGIDPDADGAGKTVWCELALVPDPSHLQDEREAQGRELEPEVDLDSLLARYDDSAPALADGQRRPGGQHAGRLAVAA
jgi:hypothetical protein